jgi:predicted Zn-dependent peptidase
MRSYFERRYSPGNMTLVAAGRVEFEQLVAQAEHLCGGWQPFETRREAPSLAPRNGREIFVKDSAVQQYVVLMSRGPAATDNDRYAARVLGAVLGDDSGSRLYWDLVETGLAEYAVLASHEFQGAGIFMAFLCCTPEQTVENLDRIQGILSAAEQEGITESELMQAKNKIAAQVVLASERASNRLFAVGSGWTQRREYRTVKETVDAYQAVTLDDVRAVLDNYQLTQNTMVAVGPLTDLPDLAG